MYGIVCFQIMLLGQQSLCLPHSAFLQLLAWQSESHWKPSCSDLSRGDMQSKGVFEGEQVQAGALTLGVGWDMRSSFSGACVCGSDCEHMCDCHVTRSACCSTLSLRVAITQWPLQGSCQHHHVMNKATVCSSGMT